MVIKKIVIGLLFCIVCSQCLEPFDFGIEESDVEKVLVVDGVLSNSIGPHKITLSRTQPFGLKFIDPVTNAKIILNNQYEYTEEDNGEYILNDVKIEIGKEYVLEITLADGKIYSSSPTQMPSVVKADSSYVKYELDIFNTLTGIERISKVINIYIDSPLPNNSEGQQTYLRWVTDGLVVFPEESCGGLHMPKTCYIYQAPNAQTLTLQSSENITGNRLIEQQVAQKNNHMINDFKALYVFSTYQYSITKESFSYWSRLQSLANQSGTVFDLPPAALHGNVRNVNDENELVLGYFDVAAVDTVRARVIGADYRTNINGIVPCSPFNRRRWPTECCECLVLEGAGTERPEWLK